MKNKIVKESLNELLNENRRNVTEKTAPYYNFIDELKTRNLSGIDFNLKEVTMDTDKELSNWARQGYNDWNTNLLGTVARGTHIFRIEVDGKLIGWANINNDYHYFADMYFRELDENIKIELEKRYGLDKSNRSTRSL